MNKTTYVFNMFMKQAAEDIELITDPYNRAMARINVMKALAMTNGVEANMIGEKAPTHTQTPRETLDNAPNIPENKTNNSPGFQQGQNIIPGTEPGINTNGAPCGSEDIPVRPEIPTPPPTNPNPAPAAPAPEANAAATAQPAAAVQQNPPQQAEKPFIDPSTLGDTWTQDVIQMLNGEVVETMALIKANRDIITPTLMSEISIEITNGAITTIRKPSDIPPKFYRIFLSVLKKRVVDMGGTIPA